MRIEKIERKKKRKNERKIERKKERKNERGKKRMMGGDRTDEGVKNSYLILQQYISIDIE